MPASVVFERDFYGNAVNVVTIEESHTELAINATAEVEVSYRRRRLRGRGLTGKKSRTRP